MLKGIIYKFIFLTFVLYISINTLHESMKKKFNDYSITPQHLGKVIRDNNITRKRTTRRHYPETRYGKAINLKSEIKKFYSVVDKFTLDKIICLDEISIHAMMRPSYSRCELGKKCVMKTTNNTVFIKYTIIAAISSNGVIGWKMYKKGGMTGERMVEFINDLSQHKFCISPRGGGIDCHRHWECLYLGVIPIVEKSIVIDSIKELPLLIVDNYNEITTEYLNKKYDEMTKKNYCLEKLDINYWINKIEFFNPSDI
mgnify:CR=1 FL=1